MRWAKRIATWGNAVTDAWNMGEAPWAYDAQGSVVARLIAAIYKDTGSMDAAADAVEKLARDHGVNPKVHRWHGKG